MPCVAARGGGAWSVRRMFVCESSELNTMPHLSLYPAYCEGKYSKKISTMIDYVGNCRSSAALYLCQNQPRREVVERPTTVWWYIHCTTLHLHTGEPAPVQLSRAQRLIIFSGDDLNPSPPHCLIQLCLSSSSSLVSATHTRDTRAKRLRAKRRRAKRLMARGARVTQSV